ncbi:hypothetical protein RJ641_011831 [Dillenia turbinata]|uniref:Uncharacterized protein n=1 Tax=Dillenia turbinata TaxID=194707 RepID=A0AAN8V6B5_9MAGN
MSELSCENCNSESECFSDSSSGSICTRMENAMKLKMTQEAKLMNSAISSANANNKNLDCGEVTSETCLDDEFFASNTRSQKKGFKKQKKKEKYSLKELKTLGHQLPSSREHINNLPLLLSFISSSSPPQQALESLLSLCSFFTPLLPKITSFTKRSLSSSKDDPEFIYRTCLKSKFDDFVNSLIHVSLSPHSEDTLRDIVLDTIMEFVKTADAGNFHSSICHRFLHSIVYSEHPVNMLLDLLASKYFKYIDVRKHGFETKCQEFESSRTKYILAIYN